MVFKGIYPAPQLEPLKYGLFSAADVVTHTARQYDERWVRGFSQEFDTRPTVRLLDNTGAEAYEIFDGSRLKRWYDVRPFFVEVEDFRSAFDVPGEDRFARVLNQLEAATQKAVEEELWNGWSSRADDNDNIYLTKPGACQYASATPAEPEDHPRGLAMLEHALAHSPIGEQGFLHFPRDLATHLGSQWLLMRVEDDRTGKKHIETVNGTTVSVGAGNSGDGPLHEVTTKALTSNVATITTSDPHYLAANETVRVSGVGAPFDGEWVVKAAPTPTTFTFDVNDSNVGSTSATGLVQMVATNDIKWMFATGHTYVHLGKPELVNESLGQGFDVSGSQNDMRIKALRPAAVYFDPTLHYAIKVRLTA